MADSSGFFGIDRLWREKEELAEANARLAAEKLGLERDRAKLERELAEARERIEQLQGRIEELERTAARQTAPFRRRESQKVSQKKRPGRKAGHRGVRRPRPPHVDHEVEVPLAACPQCGGAVQDRAPLTQYIEELPPVRPVVTRLTTWKGVCPQCGEVHSTHPLQVSRAQGAARVQLGPRAAALATMLNKQFSIPLRKTCSILRQAFGLQLSCGGLVQLQHRMANKLKPRYEALREQVRRSDANYMDETSWYVGDPHWVLWVCTSSQYTLYHVDSSHGGGVAEKLLGREYAGVLVTDCHGAYKRMKCPQHKCIAHHLRALSKSRGKNPTPVSGLPRRLGRSLARRDPAASPCGGRPTGRQKCGAARSSSTALLFKRPIKGTFSAVRSSSTGPSVKPASIRTSNDQASWRADDRVPQEAADAVGRVHVALPQDGVQKAVAEAGDQRMVGDCLVIAVIRAALLLPEDFDREAVDVDGRLADAAVGARRADPAVEPIGKRVTDGFAIAAMVSQDVDQPRLCRLTAQPLLGGLFAVAVPDGELEGRVVAESVQVVLGGVAQGQGIQPEAEQFQQRVANAVLPPRIGQLRGQRLDQPQPMIGLAEQDRPAIRSQPITARRNLDGPLKRRLQ